MVTTLAVLIEEFLLDGRARRLAPKTLSSYASNLGYFLEWLAREGLPDALASFTLANGRRSSRALAHRTARRATFVAAGGPRGVHALVASDEARKPTTAVGSLRALKTFSKWLAAEEQGYAARDVLAGLRLPKCPKTRGAAHRGGDGPPPRRRRPARPDRQTRLRHRADLLRHQAAAAARVAPTPAVAEHGCSTQRTP